MRWSSEVVRSRSYLQTDFPLYPSAGFRVEFVLAHLDLVGTSSGSIQNAAYWSRELSSAHCLACLLSPWLTLVG